MMPSMPVMPTMSPRQAAFRADYRQRISPWYSGLAHVLVIAALGIATIWYCARHIPFMNTIRRHHIAHHDQAIMMGTNMNLTYPIADWLFGTSDLDRGLIGHVFNGYDTRYRKQNLKKVRATAEDSRLAAAKA